MIGSTYNNGVSETRTYKADNTLAAINFSGAVIGNLSYAWDANKNKTAEAIGGTMSGYGFTIPGGGYDTEDRLVSYVRTDGGLNQSWNLSPVGDWNSVTTNSVAQNRTHGPTHELTAINTTAILHDAKGNLTQNSSGHLYTWDFDNRLQGANTDGQPGNEVSYQWDALGRRIFRDDGATSTVFVPSGQQTIADYASGAIPSSPTYNYVYATYIDEPVFRYKPSGSESLYFHRNQQFSVTALTDNVGSIVEHYAYTAYGAPTILDGSGVVLTTSAINNRYTYTGREYDAMLSLYHYRARMYDANLGRFCGRDPIGYLDGNSMYNYVAGDPLSHLDPLGLKKIYLGAETIIYKFFKSSNLGTSVSVNYWELGPLPGPCRCPDKVYVGLFSVKETVLHIASVTFKGRVTSQKYFDFKGGASTIGVEIRFYGSMNITNLPVLHEITRKLHGSACMSPEDFAILSSQYAQNSDSEKLEIANALARANAVYATLKGIGDGQVAISTVSALKDMFDSVKNLFNKGAQDDFEGILEDIYDHF